MNNEETRTDSENIRTNNKTFFPCIYMKSNMII